MQEDEDISRRDFMKTAISLIGGLIGTALGLPAVVYLIGPAAKTDQADWLRVSSLSRIELGKPTLFKPKVTHRNGWVVEDEEVGVFILTEDGRKYTALSNICTHLGCRVRWIPEQQQFHSPCHHGIFDKYGYVVSGPPPRPLDEFKTKIEEGNLYIQLPAFKRTS